MDKTRSKKTQLLEHRALESAMQLLPKLSFVFTSFRLRACAKHQEYN